MPTAATLASKNFGIAGLRLYVRPSVDGFGNSPAVGVDANPVLDTVVSDLDHLAYRRLLRERNVQPSRSAAVSTKAGAWSALYRRQAVVVPFSASFHKRHSLRS
jgi:hypothetical protein